MIFYHQIFDKMKRGAFVGIVLLIQISHLSDAWGQTFGGISTEQHNQEVQAHRKKQDAEFRDPDHSPLSARQIRKFKGLPYFPVNRNYCVEATFVPDSTSTPFQMKTTTNRLPEYRKYGELHFILDNQPLTLSVFQNLELMQKPGYEDYLFVPFTDLTNGEETYGGGRYLDLRKAQLEQKPVKLDFNLAYNPYCAYGGSYSCPIPPAENRLNVSIRAGVKSDH